MSAFSDLTRYAQVRAPFTEEGTYRDALGRAEPLRVFVADGPLDAPEWMPAGAMRSIPLRYHADDYRAQPCAVCRAD